MARIALAWLFRRPVQLLAVLGVGVGLLALLVVLAVMNGLIEMNRSGVRSLAADLHLIPPPPSRRCAGSPGARRWPASPRSRRVRRISSPTR